MTSISGHCKSRGRDHDLLLPFLPSDQDRLAISKSTLRTHREVCYHTLMLFSFTPSNYHQCLFPTRTRIEYSHRNYMHKPQGNNTMRLDKNKTKDLG